MKKNKIYILIIINLLFIGCKTDSSNKVESTEDFISIVPDIFLFKDICNVYVLRSGNSALLIDAGSGKIKNHLKEIGIDTVNWILLTHYHRDQSMGCAQLKKEGAKIALSGFESKLIERAESTSPFRIPEKFLLNGELPGWGRRMSPFSWTGVDETLEEGDIIKWNEFKITILKTPGHTQGSNSFVVESNHKKLCFTGDLILEGGHVRNLYSIQWIYLNNPGVDSSIVSLEKVGEIKPDLLLPSHGALIKNPNEDIQLLSKRLSKFKESFEFKREGRWNWSQFIQVSEHVIQDGGSTSQIVISDDGKALLFDCGKEFSPERLKEAKVKFGIKHIDVIIPSHWHYDHVDGISEIVKIEGTKVWVWEGLAEYLQYPEHFPTTCWTGKPIKVDRILKEKEEFEWGGYSFKVYQNPVHMEQQMALYAKVDGLDFYLVADGTGLSREGIRSSIHCYNGISLASGLLKTAESLNEANPYICLSAHSNVFALNNGDKEEFLEWSSNTTKTIRDLLPPINTDLAYDPYWVTFYPARLQMKADDIVEISLRLKNYSGKDISGKCWLKSYGDIIFENKVIQYEMKPGEIKDFPVKIESNQTTGKEIHIVTADIEYGDELFAEFPQAYIEIDE